MSEKTPQEKAKIISDYMKRKKKKKKEEDDNTSLFDTLFGARRKALSAGKKKG